MDKQAEEFMLRHKMHPDCIQMEACCKTFQTEMQRGLNGQKSTLMMLPAYVTPEQQVPQNVPAIVLDAGGTNLRIGVCTFTNDGFQVMQSNTMPMPGTRESLTMEMFLSKIADLIEPLFQSSTKIGFCFSFPAQITPDLDGIPLEFNKEVDIQENDGSPLCAKLCDILQSRGLPRASYALINDTVATLMGGYGSTNPDEWDGYIGLILGTGTNCCYTEKIENMKTVAKAKGHTMVVNMEAGGYGCFPSGDFDRIVDTKSNNPGDHLYEKMVSGGYLGLLAGETLKGAMQEGVLSGGLPEQIEMKTVSEFLENPGANNPLSCSVKEQERLYTILDLLIERAAKMVAVGLTATMLQGDMGRSPVRPTCIVAEGSTLLKSAVYQRKLQYHMHRFATQACGRYFRFRSVPDVNLKGAAAAVLLA